MIEEKPWDVNTRAEEILTRCRRTLRMYKGVYKSIGKPFEYREPTSEEMLEAIKIEAAKIEAAKTENAKNPPKTTKKPPK